MSTQIVVEKYGNQRWGVCGEWSMNNFAIKITAIILDERFLSINCSTTHFLISAEIQMFQGFEEIVTGSNTSSDWKILLDDISLNRQESACVDKKQPEQLPR